MSNPCPHKTLRLEIERQADYYFREIRKFWPVDLNHLSLENWMDFMVWRRGVSPARTGQPEQFGAEYDQKAVDVIQNLAMLVRRLCHRLHKHEPDAKIIDQALGYLRGEGLQGSVLRGDSVKGEGETANGNDHSSAVRAEVPDVQQQRVGVSGAGRERSQSGDSVSPVRDSQSSQASDNSVASAPSPEELAREIDHD